MQFIVCGGRDYNDKEFLYRSLNNLNKEIGIDCIIEGGAMGADFLAGQWAKDNKIELKEYSADWLLYGKSAGPIRNTKMLIEGNPDGVVAFPRANGDYGPGTNNMVAQARAAGLHIWFPVENYGI